jgi:hypothetical protein
VLKIRVRVDGNVKCEEAAPRYQFAPPNDYGELGGEQETATTSLMEGSVAPPTFRPNPSANVGMFSNNGMFNNNCQANAPNLAAAASSRPAAASAQPPSSNGDRSSLFRKSKGSKPVREWYV